MKPKPLKIDNLKIDTPLILAPMCDVSRAPYRLLCKEFGAGLAYSEMLEAGKFKMDRKQFDDFIEEERPVGAQIVGNNADNIKSLVESIQDKVDIIDFNAGCSKRRYIARKWGGWFSGHPEELGKILSKTRDFVNLPLTVKVRLGMNRKEPEIFRILELCEDIGIDAIAIHARFVAHNYLDKADWNLLKKIKDVANIPVIANGDIFSAKDAVRAFQETGCDAVMIGRGAMGNPFVFSDAKLAIAGKDYPKEHSLEERLSAFSRFLSYYKKYSQKQNFAEIKAQATWFTVGAPGTRKLRVDIQKAKNEDELMHILKLGS
ncbi:tRNA-dihydrouridine synthase B [uncultured archaeon]|nr:tRNA-dihydrouridine synthase B [uncultured archaeon]